MISPIQVRDMSPRHLRNSCTNCSLRELCLPLGLSQEEMQELDTIITQARPIKRGEALYRAGEPFRSLYAIRLGFFKASVISEDGREQVTGFHMSGELMGMDAISTDVHTCDAIALEDSEVCELPFNDIEDLSREIPLLQRHFHKVMSREIVRDHGVMLLLGNMKAEERLAAFLLNLSQRFAIRGYSSSSFHLRMTREEIGSYLGLKLETVSRTLSKFQDQGFIKVQNRLIELENIDSLKKLLNTCHDE
ncbi:fumarate/nitrate reduction transcriptional regulator Fnr [Chitinibacter fontanus]|jgi:CRP/FNR family transcriptional regulator|uniref:Fumarate/nitrate reduction transcriptional regulator Fnr n=1 Tax=Chitinibacter fontanus TaxID=1737446 RepID=A0A7D5ZFQ8_9NEIS|nr:fumarate/nitrate reduction transcriptional regulator Fnr [Chitinibacter fontanus]QLI83085.1 fumarate/nitrate reduction transcriptional regulator Fnr [Chitinibacter fontanus]